MTRAGWAEPWPDALAPTEAFARLAGRRGVFWLDSSLPRAGDGRYSLLGCEPRWVFTACGSRWRLRHADGREETDAHAPLKRLESLRQQCSVEAPDQGAHLPFFGGAVGWLSYDLGRSFEQIGNTAVDDLACPDIYLAWYDAAVVWDHQQNDCWLVGADGERPARAAIENLAECLRGEPVPFPQSLSPLCPDVAISDFARADYLAGVETVRESIARGELYQLNLVQRFECALRESPASVYLRLRMENPAPFATYLAGDGWTVLGSSPERFLEVTPAGQVRTCPIKGTRPRGNSPEEDAALCAELLASEKERAELLMIVDMLRNDLGRVCEFGSVQVQRLHDLESFATVHHLVGEVTGKLRSGTGLGELLRAVFPGGSITGAPKVSAMRAIEKLEPHRRGIGMGSLGYLSAHGRLDFNIAIRTIVCRAGRAYVPVGAGIVADSEPAAEYAETLAKARALFAALGVRMSAGPQSIVNGTWVPAGGGMAALPQAAGVFETLLIRGGEPVFFDEHWTRFETGCRWHHLAAPVSRAAMAAYARNLAQINQLADGVLRFVAWEQSGKVNWRVEAGPARPHMMRGAWRVAEGGRRLPLASPDRVCKHLRRAEWTQALHEARLAGWDEVLLSDVQGRLVEGAVSNVFFVADGILHTPGLAVGPLPGVMRAHVLALARTQGWPVREGEFSGEDLKKASEIWLTNSLIGIRPVVDYAGRALDPACPVLRRLREAWLAVHGWDPLAVVNSG